MKKCFTLLLVLIASVVIRAQVIFYVENPSELEGNYEMTWAVLS